MALTLFPSPEIYNRLKTAHDYLNCVVVVQTSRWLYLLSTVDLDITTLITDTMQNADVGAHAVPHLAGADPASVLWLLSDLRNRAIQLSKAVRTNKRQCQALADRAEQYVEAVREPASRLPATAELGKKLEPLVHAVNAVVEFLQNQSETNLVGRILKRGEDGQEIARLNTRLGDAFTALQISLISSIQARQSSMREGGLARTRIQHAGIHLT